MQNKAGIKIVDNETIEVTLSNGQVHIMREPQGHAMKGLSLDMVRAKVTDQVQMLYARICEPIITRKQFETMGLSDIFIAECRVGFFLCRRSGQERDSGNLSEPLRNGFERYHGWRIRGDICRELASEQPNIFDGRKHYSDPSDCIAVCAMEFPSAMVWVELTLSETLDWTHRAISLVDAKVKANQKNG